MAENKLADMSTEFAIQILKLTENIKGHYSLSFLIEQVRGVNLQKIRNKKREANFCFSLFVFSGIRIELNRIISAYVYSGRDIFPIDFQGRFYMRFRSVVPCFPLCLTADGILLRL